MVNVVRQDGYSHGLAYVDWIILWNNWITSHDPDSCNNGEMYFMRGNLDYEPVGYIPGQPMEYDPNSYYETTRSLSTETGIFIPVSTATYAKGSLHNGVRLDTVQALSVAANHDTTVEEEKWCILNGAPLVESLNDFLIETPAFDLNVPANPRFVLEEPFEAGVCKALCKGCFIMIDSLPAGDYTLDFGVLSDITVYYSRSIYHLIIKKGD